MNRPQEILSSTYSNGTWQDGLLDIAENMAQYNFVDNSFVPQIVLDPSLNYPDMKTVHDVANNPVDMPVAPFQYLESHDHSQLITFVAIEPGDVPFGDRSKFYKVQAFAIALYTCEGIPMLWEGQEFAEQYVLPNSGNGRIVYRRDVHWEYFYDAFGNPLVHLYRTLGTLRHTYPALCSRESFYYGAESRTKDGIVAYRRQSSADQEIAMVFLNFSDGSQSITVPFPEPGTYREMIDDGTRSTPYEISVSSANQLVEVTVPSNYSYIFIK